MSTTITLSYPRVGVALVNVAGEVDLPWLRSPRRSLWPPAATARCDAEPGGHHCAEPAAPVTGQPYGRLFIAGHRAHHGAPGRPKIRSATARGWEMKGWWPASISTTVSAARAKSRWAAAGVPWSRVHTR